MRYFLFLALLLMPAASQCVEAAPLRAALLAWESAPARPDVQRVSDALVSLAQAELSAEPGIEWVERSELDRLLAETDLAASGRIGPRSSLRVGKLARAQFLVTGRLDATDQGHTTLSLDIIDLQRGDLLASSLTSLPARAHKHYALRDEDRNTAVSALRSLLAEACSRHRALTDQPALALLFLSNSGPTSRLDAAGTRLAETLRDSSSKAGARVLRFPRARDAESEQDLALLGLAEVNDQAWRGVADLYVWGEYKELPADGIPFEQTPVEASLTLWDGTAPPRIIPWRGTVATFPEAATTFATVLRSALHKNTSASPESLTTVAKLLGDQATALARQHASSLDSTDFWASDLGKNFQRHRLFLLQTAAFLQSDNAVVRRALFNAKWNQRGPQDKLSLDALWERYNDRCLVTERYPDPFSRIYGDTYQRSLRANDLQAILTEIARDLRGEKRLRIPEARRAALLWVKEAKELQAWAASHPKDSREFEIARRALGDYLIGLGNGPYYPSSLGVGIHREMLDGAWPVIAPAFRAWFDARPEFAGETSERYVRLYSAFGEEDAAYARVLKALSDPLDPKVSEAAPSARAATPNVEPPDPPPHKQEWASAPVPPAPTILGPELPLRPRVLYRWFDTPPFLSESARRLNNVSGNSQRLLPADTVRLLGHDGRRLWIDGFLAPETTSGSAPARQIALLSPDTREFIEIGTRLPGQSRLVAAAFDHQGAWLATAFEGLARIVAEPSALTQLTPEDGLPSLKLGAVASYEGGVVIAAALPERGLAHFDATHSRWLNLSLPSDNASAPEAAPRPGFEPSAGMPTRLAGLGPWVLVGQSGIHLLDTRNGAWSDELAARRTEWQKNRADMIRRRMELMGRIQQARERGDLAAVQSPSASLAPAFEWASATPNSIVADESAFWIGGERGLVRYDPSLPASQARVEESPPIIALATAGRWLWAVFAPEENAQTSPGRGRGWPAPGPDQTHALGYGRTEPPEWRRSRIALYDKLERRWRGSTVVIGGITSLAAANGRLWAAGSTLLEFDTRNIAPPEPAKTASQPTPDLAAAWLRLPLFPLHDAVERGDLPRLKQLLAAKESPTAAGAEGWTPLHLASHLGDHASVEALLAAGADVRAFTRDGRDALGLAAARGDQLLVRRLLAAGADPQLQARPHTLGLMGFDPVRTPTPTRPPLQPSASSVSPLPDGRAQVRWQIAGDAGQDGFLIYRRDTPADSSAFAPPSLRWGTFSTANRDLGQMAGMMQSAAREWIDEHPCAPGGTSTYTVVAVNAFDRAGPPDPPSAGSISAPPLDPNKTPHRTFETHPLDRDRTPLLLASEAGHKDVVATLLKAGAARDATDAGRRTALHLACINGHTQIAEQLIEAGVPLDIIALGEAGIPDHLFVDHIHPGDLNRAGAHTALSLVYFNHHDEPLFERLLKAGADPIRGPQGALAPMAAAMGREKDLKRLLAAGPHPFVTDIYGRTVFTAALNAKRFQLARHLREAAIDPSHPFWPAPSQMPLIERAYRTAVQRSHLETIQWLRSRGFLLSGSTNSYDDPLMEALKQKSSVAIIRELVAAGANPRALPADLVTKVVDPELRAVLTGSSANAPTYAPKLAFPLSHPPSQAYYGPPPENQYSDLNRKITPDALRDRLHQASIAGDLPGIRAALNKGAGIDVTDAKGWTALCHALNARQIEAARLLIDSGASLNRLTNFGSSPLCFAVGMGETDLMDEMIDLGADPNLFESNSGSPLTIAFKDNAILEHLLDRGADPRLLVEINGNVHRAPPLFVLAQHGRLDAIRLLVAHGVDPKTALWRGQWGQKPSTRLQVLPFAAASNDLGTLDFFLNQGINPTNEDAYGNNALDWALCAKADRTAAKLRALDVKSRAERGLPPLEQ